MSYKHLNIKQRYIIEALHFEGLSTRKIAERIGVHHSTVARDLKRVTNKYTAELADDNYKALSKAKGRKLKVTKHNIELISSCLKEGWSPEQIAGRFKEINISFKTIYNWLYSKLIGVPLNCLRRKGKTQKPLDNRGKMSIGKRIAERPDTINSRNEFGHWEIDTIVSSRGKDKTCLLTLVERKTRFYIAYKMPNRQQDTVVSTLKKIYKALPSNAIKSITSDRGKEFAGYKQIEKLDIDFYFADPYSSWQRGSNENANGLLREYIPKASLISSFTDEDIFKILLKINNRPRKCLNFMTTLEAFFKELNLSH